MLSLLMDALGFLAFCGGYVLPFSGYCLIRFISRSCLSALDGGNLEAWFAD